MSRAQDRQERQISTQANWVDRLPTGFLRAIVLLLFALPSLWFVGAGHDDTWIMLFAGETLGNGPWFLNHNGVPQEISTSVLGAGLAGFASALAPLGSTYAVWKVLAWLPAIAAGMVFFEVLAHQSGKASALFWSLVLCCFPQWHYWGWGGLESGLLWLALILFSLSLARFTLRPTVASTTGMVALGVLLPLVRADALWAPLLVVIAGHVCRENGGTWRFLPGILACLATFAYHGLRHHFTGQWLPNPAYAKAPFSVDTLGFGLEYLWQFHSDSPLHAFAGVALPLCIIGSWQLVRGGSDRRGDFRSELFGWSSLLVLAVDFTTVVAGGDWMGYHRFAVRSLPLKLMVIALWSDQLLTTHLARKFSGLTRTGAIAAALVVASTGWTAEGIVRREGLYQFGSALVGGHDFRSWDPSFFVEANIPAVRDRAILLPWIDNDLRRIVDASVQNGRHLVVASYQAGYFPRELRQRFSPNQVAFVDLAGLSDYRIGSLPGWKSPLGLADGIPGWATTIATGKGALGKALQGCRPDIVYVLFASRQERELMASAAYRVAYDRSILIDGARHGAVIFQSLSDGDGRCPILGID